MEQKFEWKFIDDKGTFVCKNADRVNQLYFPLCNEAGMMSSITPYLNGDAKTGQNSFLYLPVSIEDLHNNRSSRNFWLYHKKRGSYSLTGNSVKQRAQNRFDYENDSNVRVEGGFLYHKLYRQIKELKLESSITTFCPATEDKVEINWIKITNYGNEKCTFTPTAAFPLFGRSADNLRDHRHATSLMHRMTLKKNGVLIKPTIHHDERGHEPNDISYFVYGNTGEKEDPAAIFPTVEEYIGEGGTFDWPEAVVTNKSADCSGKYRKDGMETVGALRFNEITLEPNESTDYIIVCGVTDETDFDLAMEQYNTTEKVKFQLVENKRFWKNVVDGISFKGESQRFDGWMRWVTLQPTLRKFFGCSFLPYHDYGRGGRGWRDLWQDCLALLLQNPESVKEILIHNFQGVRIDGSNATIILNGIGKFAADRNRITRVWMDHGVWPYFTMQLYINQTGDAKILNEKVTYWKDHQCRRAKKIDTTWNLSQGNHQRTKDGAVYEGTLWEHMLLQNLVCFHNVGEHNNIKLEDGDWNDQLDMAPDKGETIPFTVFYGWNLVSMADMLLYYKEQEGKEKLSVFEELSLLITPIDYDKVSDKQRKLEKYFTAVDDGISGKQYEINIEKLAEILREKGVWLLRQVRENEWIETAKDFGFFNGYYNNDGKPVDGELANNEIRMGLTAQTFAVMSGAAMDKQVEKVVESVEKILPDPYTKGIRLTIPLGDNTWNFGRGFALIYGEKENGGMFSHMTTMYMYALYSRGFVEEGYRVFKSIFRLCCDAQNAKIYPGIPEYISSLGKGMYHYVTGSGSWMVFTMLTQVFGLRGHRGNLVIEPKLVKEQFETRTALQVNTTFCDRKIVVHYQNEKKKNYGEYKIVSVSVNEQLIPNEANCNKIEISKEEFLQITKAEKTNEIYVVLE